MITLFVCVGDQFSLFQFLYSIEQNVFDMILFCFNVIALMLFFSAWKDRGTIYMKVAGSLGGDGKFWCVPEFNDKVALRTISDRLRYVWLINHVFGKHH